MSKLQAIFVRHTPAARGFAWLDPGRGLSFTVRNRRWSNRRRWKELNSEGVR